MITSTSVFGAAVVMLAIGVVAIMAGWQRENYLLSIAGGLFLGCAITLLVIEILRNWGKPE